MLCRVVVVVVVVVVFLVFVVVVFSPQCVTFDLSYTIIIIIVVIASLFLLPSTHCPHHYLSVPPYSVLLIKSIAKALLYYQIGTNVCCYYLPFPPNRFFLFPINK